MSQGPNVRWTVEFRAEVARLRGTMIDGKPMSWRQVGRHMGISGDAIRVGMTAYAAADLPSESVPFLSGEQRHIRACLEGGGFGRIPLKWEATVPGLARGMTDIVFTDIEVERIAFALAHRQRGIDLASAGHEVRDHYEDLVRFVLVESVSPWFQPAGNA
jgi:hypothetical protein